MFDTGKGITLELGLPEEKAATEPAVQPVVPQKDIEAEYLQQLQLSDEEQKMVEDFSEKIDLNNSAVILQYGSASQKKIAAFSDTALEGLRTKDLGETGEMISDLLADLKGFSPEPEEDGGFLGIFKKAGKQINKLKTRYEKVEDNIERVSAELEGHQNQILKDIVLLDKMYEANLNHFKELSMYILAGKRKLEKERSSSLLQLQDKARLSGQAHDAQAANDYAAMCERFEKKLHDLELTRSISIQMAPQIRLIQNNNAMMAEKIQSTLINTIPLWKNQMVLALGMFHSQEAMEAQREVSDLTNELLRKNAETLKMGTLAVAKESERGIVDMESIRYTNEQLIGTLDEMLKIQDEGRQKRRAAEQELIHIESQLKEKLLDFRN